MPLHLLYAIAYACTPVQADAELTAEESAAKDEARVKAVGVLAFGLLPSLWASGTMGMPGAFDEKKEKKKKKK